MDATRSRFFGGICVGQASRLRGDLRGRRVSERRRVYGPQRSARRSSVACRGRI